MLFTCKKIVNIIILVMMISSSTFAKDSHYNTEIGSVKVEGGIIWYKVVSLKKTQNKIPILILHGGPGVPHNYLNMLRHLARDRPVIFYDQLGCGHSKVLKNNNTLWNIKRYEREMETLVAHLHLKKFHLFGHSWGGALAIEYGLKHPESLKSLTLSSPLLSTRIWIKNSKQLINQLSPKIQKIIHTNERHGTTDSKAYLKAVDIYYHHFIYRSKKWPTDLIYSFNHCNDHVYQAMWGPNEFSVTGNLKYFDRMNDLKYLKMPVLITGGKFDEATSQTLAYAQKQLPQGKLIIYQKSAHMAFLEEEKKYLKDLRWFLEASEK